MISRLDSRQTKNDFVKNLKTREMWDVKGGFFKQVGWRNCVVVSSRAVQLDELIQWLNPFLPTDDDDLNVTAIWFIILKINAKSNKNDDYLRPDLSPQADELRTVLTETLQEGYDQGQPTRTLLTVGTHNWKNLKKSFFFF